MIRYEDVSIRYSGAATDAIDSVSFQARAGQLTAVVGPNGSGKTTIVRGLLRRLSPRAGRIVVADKRLEDWQRTELAREIAVVVQREEPVFPMSVVDYVTLGRHPFRSAWSPLGTEDSNAVDEALQQAGVTSLADRTTDALSGGEWQRVRLARALAQRARALVFDEPTTFLDIGHEMACFELLAALAAKGRAVLVVSHQLNLVARFADQVVLLSQGQVAAAGPPDDVMRGEILEAIYNWPLVVSRDPAVGAPALIPLRRNRTPLPPNSRPER